MTREQIMLVQASWDEIEPLSDKLGELFYRRLFTALPEARLLFTKSAREQGELLMAMLGSMVRMLDAPQGMFVSLAEIGKRHREYGVKAEYYGPFKETLLWALGMALGDAFSGQLEEAWEAMYDHLATLMQPPGSAD